MSAPALWQPELLSSYVFLVPAQPQYTSYQLADLPAPQSQYVTGCERYIVIAGKRGHHRIWLHNCGPTDYLTYNVPLDGDAPQRLAASERFSRFLMHQPGRRFGAGTAPTAYQRSRLIKLMRMLDAEQEGLPRREMAFSILYPRHVPMRSLEWKASNERRRFYRMLDDAHMICESGYRQMLKSVANSHM